MLKARPFVFALGLALLSSVSNAQVKGRQNALANLSGCFIENKGQWDSRVQYLMQKPGMNMWLTKNGAKFDLQKKIGKKIEGDVVSMHFVGATSATDQPLRQEPGDFNYFLGKDPKRWRSHVHRYQEIRTSQIYKGIALRYYLDHASPRYDLIVEPGANPSQVAMKFDGAEDVHVASNGDLQIQTPFGSLQEKGLVAYQENNGTRTRIACRIENHGDVAKFVTGPYDKNKRLVIDPLLWTTNFYGIDQPSDFKLLKDGSFALGLTVYGGDFPTTNGCYELTATGSDNVVLANVKGDLSGFIFATYIGNDSVRDQSQSWASGVAVDPNGNFIVTGGTRSAAFPTTSGAFQTAIPSGNASDYVFVSKIDPTGSTLLFSSILGPGDVTAFTVDSKGNAWLGGTPASGFPITDGTSGPGGFISELSADGSTLLASTLLNAGTSSAGQPTAVPTSMVFSNFGNLYVSGSEWSSSASASFPTTTGAPFSSGYGFLAQLSTTSGKVVAATDLPNAPSGFTTNGQGQPVVYMETATANLPTSANAFQPNLVNANTTYVAIFNGSLTGLVAATYVDGTNPWIQTFSGGTTQPLETTASGLTVDKNNYVILAGSTTCANFPTTYGAFLPRSGPFAQYYPAFVLKLTPNLTSVFYGTLLWEDVTVKSMVADAENNLYYLAGPSYGYVQPNQLPLSSNVGVGSSSTFGKLNLSPGPSLTISPATQTGGLTSKATINLLTPAPAGGVTIPLMAVPQGAATVPASVTVPAGQKSVSFSVVPYPNWTNSGLGIWAQVPGGYQTFPMEDLVAKLSSVSWNGTGTYLVEAGSNAQLMLHFTGPVWNGYSVQMGVNQMGFGVTPIASQTFSIPSGSSKSGVMFSVGSVSQPDDLQLVFQDPSSSVTANVTVTPTAVPEALTLNNPKVAGGVTVQGTVTLDGPVGSNGQVISFTSSNPAVASAPAQQSVAYGSEPSPFNVKTYGVAGNTQVTLTASADGFSASATLTVIPAPLLALSPSVTSIAGNTQAPCSVYLSGVAPNNGAAIALSSSNTNALTVPAWYGVPAQTNHGSFTLTTLPVTANTTVTVSATYLGLTKTAVVTVTPLLGIHSLTFASAMVIGGQNQTTTLTLSQGVTSDTSIQILGNNQGYADIPESVTVPKGANSVEITKAVIGVSSSTAVTLTAQYNGSSVTQSFTIVPASLLQLSPAKTSITAGQTVQCSLYLNGWAPSGGDVVSLTVSNGATLSSSAVTVPSQSYHTTFSITGGSVATATQVTITASFQGVSKQTTITVNP